MSANNSISISKNCPVEILSYIFSQLPAREVDRISIVCKLWKSIAQDETLWRFFCHRDLAITAPQPLATWKETYQNFYQRDVLQKIVTLKRPKSMTFKAFERDLWQSIISLEFKDTKAYCGSHQGIIEIWDLEHGKRLEKLTWNGERIYSLKLIDNILFSGSDGKIKLWDLSSKKSISTLMHPGWIFSLQLWDGNLVSASSNSLKIWNLATNECMRTLDVGKDFFSFCIRDNTLYTGSQNTIKIWDFSKVALLEEIAHEGRVSLLQLQGNFLASGSSLNETAFSVKIAVWDRFTKTCLFKIEDKANRVAFHFCGDLFACSFSQRVEIWDVAKREKVKELSVPEKVNVLRIDNGRLVTGSTKTVVRVWKFQPKPSLLQPLKRIFRGEK